MESVLKEKKTIILTPKAEKQRKQFLNYFLFNLFLLIKLPAAFFCGLNIKKLDADNCEVTLPYGWRSQNPFQSIYFAAQAMAAEMSTGALALLAIENANAPVGMLVVNIEATFTKKADKLTTFTCTEGAKVFEAIDTALKTGEKVPVRIESVGTMSDGTEVARFFITWSFKRKK
ncbi:MAG: hypothetical protein POELPBGB_00083 [Bacteroidia bacterium]|nr:hypothetical protein [Bacteroidia bacterium]